jgi:hypothetical protein
VNGLRPDRRDRRPILVLVLALAVVAGCRGAPENSATNPNRNEAGSSAPAPASSAKRDWGERLLSLVPSRDDPSLPKLPLARAAFSDCQPTGAQSMSMQCNLHGGPSSQAPAESSLNVQLRTQGGRVSGISLTACCSDDVAAFRPILSSQVLGSELLCSALTFVASDSVHAYRVSAPGKQDFVYMRTERATPEGRTVNLLLLLQPIEPGDECTALQDAQSS